MCNLRHTLTLAYSFFSPLIGRYLILYEQCDHVTTGHSIIPSGGKMASIMLALLFFLLAFLWVGLYIIANSDCLNKKNIFSRRKFSQPTQQELQRIVSKDKQNRKSLRSGLSRLICEGQQSVHAAKPDVEALDERNWTHGLWRIIWIIQCSLRHICF